MAYNHKLLDQHDQEFLMNLVLKQQKGKIMKQAKRLDRKIKQLKEMQGLDLSEFRREVKENYATRIGGLKEEIKELEIELNNYLN